MALGSDMMINVECKTGIDAIAKVAEVAKNAGVSKQVTVKTNSRGAIEINKVANVLAGITDALDYIPILIDQIDGLETLQQVCEDLPISCVECIVRSPLGPKIYTGSDRLSITSDGGPLFSIDARRITEANNVRRFINTLYFPNTELNGGRNCQLARIAPDSVYAFWIAHGVSVFQSDEPEYCLQWLRNNGFRLDDS